MRSFSWRLILRVITVLSWVLAILWFVAEPGYEPLIAVVAGIGTLLGSFAVSDTPITEYRPTPEQSQRNRRVMLERVRNFWVKGVLEQSLHNAAMIELGMDVKPDAVEHPWDMVLRTEREDRALPPGTKIADVFDEMSGSLLILGKPGSGKTTMLLELARDTIARAEGEPTQPVPVVFNLSSWADKRQPIAEWLIEELNTKYNVPKKVARPWVECDELLLLLDGLDEVALKSREDCVEAINEFRLEHLVPLVVCSRIADYQALTVRLRLQGAVLLQPLMSEQVDKYLEGAGIELLAVRRTLQYDTMLQELAQSPLMLSIMALAYQGMSVKDLGLLNTTDARRRHVLDFYVQQMFKRRGVDQLYSSKQTIRWLAWLAQHMSQRAQSIFLIERLQPSWLQTRRQRQQHLVTIVLISGLAGGLIYRITFESIWRIDGALIAAVIGGLIGRFIGRPASLSGPTDFIEPAEVLRFSMRKVGRALIRLPEIITHACVPLGLLVLLSLMFSVYVGEWLFGPVLGPDAGVIFWLILLMASGLTSVFSRVEIEARIVPNQGIRQSARNALIAWLTVGLIGGLTGGLSWRSFDIMISEPVTLWLIDRRAVQMLFGVFSGLLWGLILGLFVGLELGGRAVIQHFTLRLILYLHGHIPWDYAHFLDYAAGHIFLRKVGGGYIFIHRLLQDYFASLYQDQ
jgi:hypothetical protein